MIGLGYELEMSYVSVVSPAEELVASDEPEDPEAVDAECSVSPSDTLREIGAGRIVLISFLILDPGPFLYICISFSGPVCARQQVYQMSTSTRATPRQTPRAMSPAG